MLDLTLFNKKTKLNNLQTNGMQIYEKESRIIYTSPAFTKIR